ncbi:MAG: DUF3575 domain-containing protein [Flavobacterium sp.]|nr:DUF3575 domain-containing protein [Pedobacter sp.]
MLSAPAIFAQIPNSINQDEAAATELKFPKNNVKINLSSLALNNYSFFLERSLSRKISFSAGFRTMPTTNLGELAIVKKLNDKINGGDEILTGINRMQTRGNAYTGEFRFYGGKKPGARGIYLAVYGRYAQFNHNYNYQFTTANNDVISIPLKSKANGYGGGLMLGKQWLVAKRVTFDWYILGGHYGKLSGSSSGVKDLSSLSPADIQKLKQNLDDILVIGGKHVLASTVNNQGISGKIDGPFVGVRGLGFSLGIAF